MRNRLQVGRRQTLLIFVLFAGHAAAQVAPNRFDSILPGSAILDSASVMEAARMDRSRSQGGAQSQCIDDALGGSASAPAADSPRPNKFSVLLGKVKERVQLASDGDKVSQVNRCTQERRQAFVPQRGLDHYASVLQDHTAALPAMAMAATGVGVDGAPLPKGKASPSCVRSMVFSAAEWRPFPGVLTPRADQLGPFTDIEAMVSVIDVECYRRQFPAAPIPPNVEILTVHQYFDRFIEHRVSRLRSAGFGPYAAALSDAYRQAKGGSN